MMTKLLARCVSLLLIPGLLVDPVFCHGMVMPDSPRLTAESEGVRSTVLAQALALEAGSGKCSRALIKIVGWFRELPEQAAPPFNANQLSQTRRRLREYGISLPENATYRDMLELLFDADQKHHAGVRIWALWTASGVHTPNAGDELKADIRLSSESDCAIFVDAVLNEWDRHPITADGRPLPPVTLATTSPRRLLIFSREWPGPFRTIKVDTAEQKTGAAEEMVVENARRKAVAVAAQCRAQQGIHPVLWLLRQPFIRRIVILLPAFMRSWVWAGGIVIGVDTVLVLEMNDQTRQDAAHDPILNSFVGRPVSSPLSEVKGKSGVTDRNLLQAAEDEAAIMLRAFKGRRVKVMSGIAAADPVTGHTSVRLAETVVQFDALTEAQISRLAKKNIENAGALAPEDIDQLAHRTELRNASAPDLANPQDGVMARVVEGDADNSVGMPMATVNELLTECGFGKNYSRLQQRENLHNQSPYFRLKGALTPAQADELIDDLLKTGRTTMLLNVWDRLGYNAVDVPGILVFWERVAQRPAPDQESVRRLMASQLMGRGYILNKVNSPSYGSDSAAVIIQSFFPEVSASLKERLAHNMKRWSVEDRIHPPVFSFWRWLLNWHSDAQPAGFRRYYEHQQEIYAAFDILRKQPDLDLWGRLQLCQVVESGMPLGDLPMAGTTLERLALDHQSNFFRDEPEGFWDAFRHTMEERIRPQWTAIRSGGQAPHTLQLAVIGAGLGQEPLSMIAVLENIFDQLGVDRTRLTYTIHVFDRPGPVLDALRENRMLYPQDQLVYWPRKHQHFRGLEKIDAQWKPSAELHDSLRFHALNLYEPSTLEIPPELGHAMEFVSMHAVLQHVTPSNSPQPTRYAEDMLAASSFVRHLLRSDGLLSIGGIGPVHPIASQAFNGMIQTDDGWFIRESDFHKRNRALDLPTTTPTQPPNLPSSGLILRRSAWELFTPQGWLFFKGHVLAWFGRFAGWIFLSNKGQALKERAVFEEAPRREKAYWKPIQEALAQTLQGALGWQIDVDLLKDVEHIIEEITRSGWMIEAIDRGARAFAAPHGDKVIVNGQVIKLTSENRGLYHDQLRELYTHVARRMIEAAAKSFIENSQAGLLKQFSSFVISEALRASDVASVTAHAEINRARYRTGEAVGMIPRIRNLNQAG